MIILNSTLLLKVYSRPVTFIPDFIVDTKNKELHILNSSPNINRQIKSRRMRWAGHVAHMGEERNVYKVVMGKPEGKRPLGRSRVVGKLGSELILGRLAGGGWSGSSWLRIGAGGRLL
jgi:hypothetical protein